MNDETLADLKQFITATVSQQATPIIERLDRLEQKLDDGFKGVGEAIETVHELITRDKAEIDARLTTLETKTA